MKLQIVGTEIMDGDIGYISIKKSDMDILLKLADGHAALLYLYLLKNGGRFDKNAAAGEIGIYPNEIAIAHKKLSDKGILPEIQGHAPIERPDAPPEYSQDIIAKSASEDHAFKYLLGETQRRLGKLLSASELTILYGIYDYLGYSAETISLLLTYCVEEAEIKYGKGRAPTMRQIEKTAYYWARDGIETEEEALAYLKKSRKNRTVKSKIMRLLQITGRALSATESKYLDEWIALGFGPDEIYRAYDITVVKTGGLKWQYMNSIIKNWNEKGLKTLEQIESDSHPAKSAKPAQNGTGFIGEHEKNAAQWLKSRRQK